MDHELPPSRPRQPGPRRHDAAELRATGFVPIATGEHEFSRYGCPELPIAPGMGLEINLDGTPELADWA